jgi:hypothetical protein
MLMVVKPSFLRKFSESLLHTLSRWCGYLPYQKMILKRFLTIDTHFPRLLDLELGDHDFIDESILKSLIPAGSKTKL